MRPATRLVARNASVQLSCRAAFPLPKLFVHTGMNTERVRESTRNQCKTVSEYGAVGHITVKPACVGGQPSGVPEYEAR